VRVQYIALIYNNKINIVILCITRILCYDVFLFARKFRYRMTIRRSIIVTITEIQIFETQKLELKGRQIVFLFF